MARRKPFSGAAAAAAPLRLAVGSVAASVAVNVAGLVGPLQAIGFHYTDNGSMLSSGDVAGETRRGRDVGTRGCAPLFRRRRRRLRDFSRTPPTPPPQPWRSSWRPSWWGRC
jgi:hypothetical protein